MRKHGLDWKRAVPDFLGVYLGEGMESLWKQVNPVRLSHSMGRRPILLSM
jgi:hypothetical protein